MYFVIAHQKEISITKEILKFQKKNSWNNVCSNLSLDIDLSKFWKISNKFKSSFFSNKLSAMNKDCFPSYCSKISPDYVPTLYETHPKTLQEIPIPDNTTNILINSFSLEELTNAIDSRKSPVSGFDAISPIMLKHLYSKSLKFLLQILNDLWINGLVPDSWKKLRVTSIPKSNDTKVPFRLIAISSALGEIIEHILKNRLDW